MIHRGWYDTLFFILPFSSIVNCVVIFTEITPAPFILLTLSTVVGNIQPCLTSLL